jgi:ParB family chromosome partitioning protein
MAKRRRLTPAQADYLPAEGGAEPRPLLLRPGFQAPPIARIAAEASVTSALEEVAGALQAARDEGRLVNRLPLEAIDAAYLMRDRMPAEDDEMQALVESIRAHGQRMAIDVVELAPGRYGLISGWRRLAALARLYQETGEARFGSVLALLRRPEASGDAYVAMVEENEIRAALSYYERARIVGRSVEAGVFASEKEALQRLFSTASRAKRSKIGSFLVLYRELGEVLRFPAAIPERLGLRLVQALAERGTARRIAAALAREPAGSAEEEARLLADLIAPPRSAAPPAERRELAPGLYWQDQGKGRVLLSGAGLTDSLRAALEDWLRRR